MNRKRALVSAIFLAILALHSIVASMSRSQRGTAWASITDYRSDGSVAFIENVGQFDQRVLFQARSGKEVLWLSEEGLWLTFLGESSGAGDQIHKKGLNVKIEFLGANKFATIESNDPVDTVHTYGTAGGGYAAVPAWARLRITDLYPGVDLIFSGLDGRWQWQLAPRFDVAMDEISLYITGTESISLLDTTVTMRSEIGDITLPELFAGQHSRPATVAGDIVSFPLIGHFESDFQENVPDAGVPSAAPNNPTYSTFVGDLAWEEGKKIAVDSNGNALVTGYTESLSFPETAGLFEPEHGIDVFVFKLNPSGTNLDYSLWFNTLTQNAEDYGNSIAVDDSGHAYVAGYTYSDEFCEYIDTVPGAYESYNGNGDAYVMKIKPDGSGLVYCTYLGGAEVDLANAIALDENSNVYIAGSTWSADFPIVGGYDSTHNNQRDVFVAKLDAAGTTLLYSTFLGGGLQDEATAIALDEEVNAYITGWTTSGDFETTAGAFSPFHSGGTWDLFVSKLNSSGTELIYSTFLGGGGEDRGNAIAVDREQRAIVSGMTRSSDFPTTQDAFDVSHGGGICGTETCSDAFVTQVSYMGDGLSYSTFLGGSQEDQASDLRLDQAGHAYLCGTTSSLDFPIVGSSAMINGEKDAFLSVMVNSGASLEHSMFIGGSQDDGALGLWLGLDERIYLTGRTQSDDFPVTPGSFDQAHNGDYDVFVTTLDIYKALLPIIMTN